MARTQQTAASGRYWFLDLLVIGLVVALVALLLFTMGIRTKAANLETECQERLLALAQAQQTYLIKHRKYAESLPELRAFLEPEQARIPFVCPITGNDFEVRVQGDRYMILAPGTEFSILTGDPSW